MVQSLYENNVVVISGIIATESVFSHEVYGEGFYNFMLDVKRLSDSYDRIPVTVSERLGNFADLNIGAFVEINGQFRSYNSSTGENSKLLLTVFARDIFIRIEEEEKRHENQIALNGFICKKPVYRTTPFGREISDILLAVNRSYNKSDYIPCISWGRNARYCSTFSVGDNVKVWGRIQSREYQKKLYDGSIENRVAYEVSVSKLEVVREDAENAQNSGDDNSAV